MNDLVSCLIVTQEKRLSLLRDSLKCFKLQSYPNLEAVIIVESLVHSAEVVAICSDLDIQNYKTVVADPTLSLGALRNLSADHARGEILIQWDDDDLYHPDRVREQVLGLTDSIANVLKSQLYWFEESGEVYVRRVKYIHGTICYRKSLHKKVRYPEMSKGEDTVFFREVFRCGNVSTIDRPSLYIRRYHGSNTWDEAFHKINVLGANNKVSLTYINNHVPEIAEICEKLRIRGSLTYNHSIIAELGT